MDEHRRTQPSNWIWLIWLSKKCSKFLLHTTWMELKLPMQSERSREKGVDEIPFIEKSRKCKLIHNNKKQISGCPEFCRLINIFIILVVVRLLQMYSYVNAQTIYFACYLLYISYASLQLGRVTDVVERITYIINVEWLKPSVSKRRALEVESATLRQGAALSYRQAGGEEFYFYSVIKSTWSLTAGNRQIHINVFWWWK